MFLNLDTLNWFRLELHTVLPTKYVNRLNNTSHRFLILLCLVLFDHCSDISKITSEFIFFFAFFQHLIFRLSMVE